MKSITVKDLIQKIKGSEILDEKQKSEWLALIPKMDTNELNELASIVYSSEAEQDNLLKSSDYVISGMAAVFTAMNEVAIEKSNIKN